MRCGFCGQWWCLAIWVLFFSVIVPSTVFQVWVPPPNYELEFSRLRPTMAWQNWPASVRCHPASFSSPSTEGEIIAKIKHAQLGQQKVKVVGASHSWSPIVCSGEDDTNHFMNSSNIHLISMENFNNLVSIDSSQSIITVQAGMRIKKLVKILRQNNRALDFVPSYDELTVGGIISTGAHASSRWHSSFSTLVSEMRLITADGSIRTIQSSDPLFQSAGISLGLLGVISTVTIRTVPLYTLSLNIAPMSPDAFFSHVSRTRNNTSVLGTWLPYTDSIFTLTIMPLPPSRANLHAQVMDYLIRLATRALWAFLEIETVFSDKRAIEIHETVLHPLLLKTSNIQVQGSSWEDGFLKEDPKRLSANAEWFIPLKKCKEAFDRFVEETNKVKALVNEDKLEWGGGFFSGLLPIRVMQGEDFMMSVAPKDESIEWCAIDVHMVSQYRIERTEIERIAEEVFEKEFGARRHWGKELGRVTNQELRRKFPRLEEFLKVRQELDPQGLFLNNWFARVLDIPQH
eukprot:TRINITY_DN11742_c0_g1_i1.p1 TRINITY_DN11742_c0_g1~~TRINITY_DN11742_c0_g1_i1.p1  ORF type:complete len:515 (-),score=108.95 TRINITY_DN11742_c0_g1_i1:98-1642(-)